MSGLNILGDQGQISKQYPQPVDDMSVSSANQAISGETVSLYYSNAGTRTIDAGQAAGTAVTGKLVAAPILDVEGHRVASLNDTSLSFTGNCFTTERSYPTETAEKARFKAWKDKLSDITNGFANGEYCIDYATGAVYGVKATTTSSLTSAAYTINRGLGGGTTTLPSNVNLDEIGGENVGDHGSAVIDHGVQPLYEARSTQAAADTEGNAIRGAVTLNQEQIMAGYSYTNQNLRTGETDPISTHHLETTAVVVTNGTDGTYYYYSDMDGYSALGSQLTLSGGSGTVTVTLEGTMQDDGTAQASCTYIDVTNDAFGSASYTASTTLNDSAGFFGQFKYVRYKVVASTGGANDADWTIYNKRKY